MARLRRRAKPSDEVSEGFSLRALLREFGPLGLVLAPLGGLVLWLWRRSRQKI